MGDFDIEKIKSDISENRFKTRSPKSRRKWECTDATTNFNFENLVRKIKNDIVKNFPDVTPEERIKKVEDNLKLFTINNQIFEYLKKPATLGGVRWYVLCPKCKRPVLKLYLPNNEDREHRYLCQACHRLKPSSLMYENNSKYRKIARPIKRMEHIRKKLLKKNIDINVAKKLLEEYEELERALYNTPEYKLWLFKQEHGKDHY